MLKTSFCCQSNETVVSNTIKSSYPIETEGNEDVLNASHILNHNESFALEQTLERTCSENRTLLQIASLAFLDATRSQSNVTDTSSCEYNYVQLLYSFVQNNIIYVRMMIKREK